MNLKLENLKVKSFVTAVKTATMNGGITANPHCAGPGTQDPSTDPGCSEVCTVENTWQIGCDSIIVCTDILCER